MAAARGRSGSGQSLEDLLGNEGTTATFVFNAIMTAAAQPLTCVRLLVQVGHEPISPTEFTTFYQYACYVKKINVWHGLYRGLLPRVYSSLIGTLVNNTMLQAMDKKDNALVPLVPPENKSRREELLEFFEETCVQAVAKCSGIIISHPFYVISVRMMVQFVGQETIYSGLCASVKEIYNNEGLGGFFSGIIPRLVGEVLSLLLYRGVCFLVSKYAIDSEVGRSKEVQVYRYVLFQV
nr:mitochondrial carrier homolog 2-like isoform X4 [Pocillopora verrucosa]